VLTGDGGQATVELIALLPLLLAAALAAAALLAAHSAGEQAGQAAEAGAIALLQGRDPAAAARAALPAGARDHADIAVDGHRITVTLRPHLPVAALEESLTAHATATAGPAEPVPAAPPASRSQALAAAQPVAASERVSAGGSVSGGAR
jgi:hypothetical protein